MQRPNRDVDLGMDGVCENPALCEANCCHKVTCCYIRETEQSLEPANRMDVKEECGGTAAAR